MRADVRRLAIDRVRRYWWVWALLGAFQLGMVVVQTLGHANHYYNHRDFAALVVTPLVFLPAAILNGEQQRWRWLQGALTLPVSRREAGLALWWVGIGFPTVLIVLLSVLGALGTMAGTWSDYPFVDAGFQLSLWGHVGFGILGIAAGFALLLLVMPSGPVGSGPGAATLAQALIAVPVVMAAMFFPANLDQWPVLALGTAAAGLLAALYLHRRPEALVLRRLGWAPAATFDRSKHRPTPDLAAQSTGWTVIARRVAWAMLRSILVFGVLVALGQAAFYAMVGRVEFAEAAHFWVRMKPMLVSAALCVAPLLSLQWISGARALRALPLTADRLAGALLAMTCGPTVILLLAFLAVGALVPGLLSIAALPFATLVVPPQPLLVPLVLRFGARGWQGIAVFYALLVSFLPAMSSPILPYGAAISAHAAAWLGAELALTVMLGVAGHLWARHELRSGRHAFRGQSAWLPVTLRGAR